MDLTNLELSGKTGSAGRVTKEKAAFWSLPIFKSFVPARDGVHVCSCVSTRNIHTQISIIVRLSAIGLSFRFERMTCSTLLQAGAGAAPTICAHGRRWWRFSLHAVPAPTMFFCSPHAGIAPTRFFSPLFKHELGMPMRCCYASGLHKASHGVSRRHTTHFNGA